MGKIIKENKKLITVQKKNCKKKIKWINTTETAQWRKNKCNKIKIIIDSSDNINRVEIIKKETIQTNTSTEISKNNSNKQEDEDKAPVGLWHLWTGPEARMYIQNNATNNITAYIASNGTVRDLKKQGNWSWFTFFKKRKRNM